MRKSFGWLVVLLLSLACPMLVADEREEMRLYMQGSFIYQRHCADCHGKSGRGDGPLAAEVRIRPRDFRKAVFKFRSTPMGFLPTDDDLARTIRGGVAGSLMPAFEALGEREVRALLVFIKAQSPRWHDPKLKADPLIVPDLPDWFQDPVELGTRRAAGREVFALHCASCHGAGGRGDGLAAPGLLDLRGQPIVPADLTKPTRRSGPRRADSYRTVAMGLDGTPMLGFLEPLGAEAIWELVAYLETLVVER